MRVVYRCPLHQFTKCAVDLVGLAGTGRKDVNQFFLGEATPRRWQRTSQPSLLILDEPTSSSTPRHHRDAYPAQASERRASLSALFISSHLLAEIEKLVSHVGVIHRGTLRVSGTLPALNRLADLDRTVTFEVDDLPNAARFQELGVTAGRRPRRS